MTISGTILRYLLGRLTSRRPGALLALLLLLLPLAAAATHIVGGELELQHQTGSTYQLTLNLYFDAINGNPRALDASMTASIFEKGTNRRIQDLTLPLTSNTFVTYTNPVCTVGALSTRKLVYTQALMLAASTYANPAGYYVAVERCCRNVTISNITDPGGAAQTFYLEFPAVVRNGQPFLDSTPRIFPPLGDYACLNELFYYDFGGQDVDGDSLVYDMVTPLNGHANRQLASPTQAQPAAYAPVTWVAGRSTASQIPGSPTLGIEARTGRLTVRPSQLGLFVFGVRCQEFRKGEKIGETRRDFQLYVLKCPQNTAPSLRVFRGATGAAAGAELRAGRDTLRLPPAGNRCLRVRFTDPDPASALTLSLRPVNYAATATAPLPTFTTASTGTVRGAGLPDTLTATLCFPECLDSQGKVLLLDVIVADNGCSLPRRDTVRLAFTAAPYPNVAPELRTTFPPAPLDPAAAPVLVQVRVGETYTATLSGTDADPNPLTLSAAGQGFDLAAARMRFTAQNGTGQASGTFQWQATCTSAQSAAPLDVKFTLAEATPCRPLPQTRTVRFQIVPAADTVAFRPPNIITPNGDDHNEFFALPDLPPDFCDQHFAGIRIYSRWGREVYHSPDRSFRWAGGGTAGLYYYLVTYTDGRKFKGWLEVVSN